MKARIVVTTQTRTDPRKLEIGFHIPSPQKGEPAGYGKLVLFHEPAEGAALERDFGIATEHELETRQVAGPPAPIDESDGPRRMRWLGAP